MPDWYPETALEAHGLTPDDFGSAGVYALALETPDFGIRFAERWATEYDVPAPSGLAEAIQTGRELYYVGATGCLRDRLHDHVTGDKRRVKLLSVCPPTGVVDVWRYDSFDAAAAHERRHAYGITNSNPLAAVWVNGELL